MISKQAVLDVLKNYGLDDLDTAYLTSQINLLPSISEDGFKRDIIFKLSLALSDYFNDDQLSLIKQCLNKLIPVPISDGWISVETELPEHFDDVIFLYENGFQVIGKYSINSKRYLTHLGEDYDNNPATFNSITHWQPLPQKPQK